MVQNFDYWRYEQVERVSGRFDRVRRSVRRSPHGLLLGVFRGIAESRGYSVLLTRIVGLIALVFLSGGSLLAAGFFYLLAAVLMRSSATEQLTLPPLRTERSLVAMPGREASCAPRVDFTVLDRQLDGLDRRIQSLEGVVTDRHEDWDRRLES